MARLAYPQPGGGRCDVVVIGGGLVGASLALALAAAGVAVAVVEPAAVDFDDAAESMDSVESVESAAHPSFDGRTVALTYSARQIYERLGVWADIAAHAEAIVDIHISERGGFGMAHLHRAAAGAEALGYVAPARALGRALHRRLRLSDSVEMYCPASAEELRQTEAAVEVGVLMAGGNGAAPEKITLSAPLVALADGGRSKLAAQAGLPTTAAAKYRQCAIVSVVATDRDHRGRAYERFTAEGPLALLPHSARRYAVVWTSELQNVAARLALDDGAFVAALQVAFGDRAGNFSDPAARAKYDLRYGAAASPVARRAVSIGNAAHVVHPVAGQGFNLGLRDAAALAAVVGQAAREGKDLGGAEVLAKYAALRRRETARVGAFTDGLIRVFGSRRRPVKLARNAALAGLEFCPVAKRFLLRRTMGLAANLPLPDTTHGARI